MSVRKHACYVRLRMRVYYVCSYSCLCARYVSMLCMRVSVCVYVCCVLMLAYFVVYIRCVCTLCMYVCDAMCMLCVCMLRMNVTLCLL